MHETCLILHYDLSIDQTKPGIKPRTFGSVGKCSTSELTPFTIMRESEVNQSKLH